MADDPTAFWFKLDRYNMYIAEKSTGFVFRIDYREVEFVAIDNQFEQKPLGKFNAELRHELLNELRRWEQSHGN